MSSSLTVDPSLASDATHKEEDQTPPTPRRERLWKFPAYSVIMMVGPSGVGKSTLAKYLFDTCVSTLGSGSCMYLSSDKIRDRLAHGCETSDWSIRSHKYDTHMLRLSEAAFRILDVEFEMAISYPNHMPFVIVDSTALSETFRQNIIHKARAQGYTVTGIVFNLDTGVCLDQQNHDPAINQLIADQQRRLKKVLGTIGRGFTTMYKINRRPKQWSEQHVLFSSDQSLFETVQDGDTIRSKIVLAHTIKNVLHHATLNPGLLASPELQKYTWYVIGNVRNDEEALRRLLHKLPEMYLADVAKTHFCLKPRMGLVFIDRVLAVVACNSQGNLEYAYCGNFQIHGRGVVGLQEFIVTPTMCKTRSLGKSSVPHLADQCGHAYHQPPTSADLETVAQFVDEQGRGGENHWPVHIFGGCPVKEVSVIANQVLIDTGCGFGGRLTAIALNKPYTKQCPLNVKYQRPLEFHSVADSQPRSERLCPLAPSKPETGAEDGTKKKQFATYAEYLLHRRVQRAKNHAINFVSGTISPAPSKAGELESFKEGLRMFQRQGITQVVIQPKYMGSRCQLYIFPHQMQKSYAVSRNGAPITAFAPDTEHTETEEAAARRRQMVRFKFEYECRTIVERLRKALGEHDCSYHLWDMLIVDCELLPWSFLGEGLIDDFERFGVCHHTFLQFMKDNAFEQAFTADVQWATQIKTDYSIAVMPKEKVLAKLRADKKPAQHWYEKVNAVLELQNEWVPLALQQEQMRTYDEQMQLYGRPPTNACDFHLKPFDLLKIVYIDQTEKVMPFPHDAAFRHLQSDEIHVVTFPTIVTATTADKKNSESTENDNSIESDACGNDDGDDGTAAGDHPWMISACEYFNKICQVAQMEGVVLKPGGPRGDPKQWTLPFLKVRNPRYLSIIYGPNYLHQSRFCAGKKIGRKLAQSRVEYDLGRKMLERPYHQLQTDPAFEQHITHFFTQEDQAKQVMDARL